MRVWQRKAGAWSVRFALWVLLSVIVSQVHGNLVSLRQEEELLARRDQVLKVRGGDVDLRDVPKAQQILDGRLFSDPHYEGEVHWYPFAGPLLAAGVSKVANLEVPNAYFRYELLMVASWLLALGTLLWRVTGWWLVVTFPIFVFIGPFSASTGLYPLMAVRAVLLVTLLLGGRVLATRRLGSRMRTGLAFGAAIGITGLWNGAGFFMMAAAGAAVCALSLLPRHWPDGLVKYSLSTAAAIGAGASGPMALLLLPQWIRYGRIEQAHSARVWLEPGYAGGTDLWRAFDAPVTPWPKLLLAVLAVLWTTRRFQPCADIRWAVRWLLLACVFAATVARAGFALHDTHYPALSSFLLRHIPAPPHTFGCLSDHLIIIAEILGLAAALELTVRSARWAARTWTLRTPQRAPYRLLRFRQYAWTAFWGLVPPALALLARNAYTYPIDRWEEPLPGALLRFANAASQAARRSTVLARDPGVLIGAAPFRWFLVSAPDHTNHYVQAKRSQALGDLDRALAAGDMARADSILDEYHVQHLLLGGPPDPIGTHCGGATEVAGPGVFLRSRTPCRLNPDDADPSRTSARRGSEKDTPSPR